MEKQILIFDDPNDCYSPKLGCENTFWHRLISGWAVLNLPCICDLTWPHASLLHLILKDQTLPPALLYHSAASEPLLMQHEHFCWCNPTWHLWSGRDYSRWVLRKNKLCFLNYKLPPFCLISVVFQVTGQDMILSSRSCLNWSYIVMSTSGSHNKFIKRLRFLTWRGRGSERMTRPTTKAVFQTDHPEFRALKKIPLNNYEKTFLSDERLVC